MLPQQQQQSQVAQVTVKFTPGQWKPSKYGEGKLFGDIILQDTNGQDYKVNLYPEGKPEQQRAAQYSQTLTKGQAVNMAWGQKQDSSYFYLLVVPDDFATQPVQQTVPQQAGPPIPQHGASLPPQPYSGPPQQAPPPIPPAPQQASPQPQRPNVPQSFPWSPLTEEQGGIARAQIDEMIMVYEWVTRGVETLCDQIDWLDVEKDGREMATHLSIECMRRSDKWRKQYLELAPETPSLPDKPKPAYVDTESKAFKHFQAIGNELYLDGWGNQRKAMVMAQTGERQESSTKLSNSEFANLYGKIKEYEATLRTDRGAMATHVNRIFSVEWDADGIGGMVNALTGSVDTPIDTSRFMKACQVYIKSDEQDDVAVAKAEYTKNDPADTDLPL